MYVLVGRNEVDTTWHGEVEVVRKHLMQRGILRSLCFPRKLGEPRQVTRSAVKPRTRKARLHLACIDRVKGVHVQDRLDVLAAVGQLQNLTLNVPAQRIGIEEHEPSVASPDEGRLRPDLNDPTDLE